MHNYYTAHYHSQSLDGNVILKIIFGFIGFCLATVLIEIVSALLPE